MQEQQEVVIPLVEERASTTKREVETGKVRVHSRVETVEQFVREDLVADEVEIVRIAKDEPIDVIPDVRVEGDLTIVPVVEEVLVVEKRLRLVEEIHLRRTRKVEEFAQPVTVRRVHAEIERENVAGKATEELE